MARSQLTLAMKVVAYCDSARTSNPMKTGINWGTSMANLPFENAGSTPYELAPGEVRTIIDGARTLTADDNTAYALALSPLSPDRYRLTYEPGESQVPGFRVDRLVDASTFGITVTVNANLSVTISSDAGTPFSAIQGGDVVFIPGVMTGDTQAIFDPLNQGNWTVLTPGSASITVARPAGAPFSGITETVTSGDNTMLQAWSAAGVQVGDTLAISAGLPVPSQGSYEILAVGSNWVEFQSLLPLGPQTGIIPGIAGLSVYTSAKRFLFIETDQEIVVQLNGGTDSTNVVSPILPGNCRFQGPFLKFGPVWKLVLINRSSAVANVTVGSAE